MVKLKTTNGIKKNPSGKKSARKVDFVPKHKEKLFKKHKQTNKSFKKQVKLQGKDISYEKKKKSPDIHGKSAVQVFKKPLKVKKSFKKSPLKDKSLFSADISEEDIASDDDITDKKESLEEDDEGANEYSSEESENILSDDNESQMRNKGAKKKGAASKYTLSGDISEEDIDSDDNFSLDEDELPTPPDVTSEEESSSDEEQVKTEKVDITEYEQQVPQQTDTENRTVFVGNLPNSVNKTKLKRWFTKYGTVECVRLRCAPLSDPSLPKKLAVIKRVFHDERSNIHGFVRFSTVDEATKALAANGEQFDENHHLRVDMASVRGQRKQFDDKKAVFVGNLPFGAEEDQLRDNFADCGDIICIRIVRDKHTSVGKGFAFINFASRHSVRLALEKDGLEFNGRHLRIQKAFYNQEVELVREEQNRNAKKFQQNRNRINNNKASANNVMKFKKRKKTNAEDGLQYQGMRSNKDTKRKKLSKKKKKLRNKKEVLKNVLNAKGNDKKQ